MKTLILATVAAALCAAPALAAPAPSAITTAVADPARPARDRFRDDRRKPAETLAFAQIAPGMKVAELIPGNGYYTRLLARAVRPGGRVYTIPFGEPRAAVVGEAQAVPVADRANDQLVHGPRLANRRLSGQVNPASAQARVGGQAGRQQAA